MTHRISANLITLNEERNIARCLESLRWVDEIVVMDGGSQDRTVAIALGYTDNVFAHRFDDFASQRNRALAESQGDWILSMDADERVPQDLAGEILHRVRTVDSRISGFWVPIQSRIFGRRFRYSGTQGERKMRLFRRDRGRWARTIHETVELKGFTDQLTHAIEHTSTPDLDSYLVKLNRYSSLEAEQLCTAGHSPSWWRPWLLPLWTFAKLYFGQMGVLDGPEGFRFCALSGWGRWVAYQKFLERHQAEHRPQCLAAGREMPTKEEWHERMRAAA